MEGAAAGRLSVGDMAVQGLDGGSRFPGVHWVPRGSAAVFGGEKQTYF